MNGGGGSRESLSNYTTFGVGGPALVHSVASEPVAVQTVLQELGADVVVLGHGSNVLVSDAGIADPVVVLGSGGAPQHNDGTVRVSAAESLDMLVDWCVEAGLAGLECIAGIPGTVGGAIVQNAGAFDQSMQPVVVDVTCVERETGRIVILSNEDCGFAYRDSVFRGAPRHYVVVEARLQLEESRRAHPTRKDVLSELELRGCEGPEYDLADIASAVRSLRQRKDHLVGAENRTAGSFFKNVDEPLSRGHRAEIEKTFSERVAAIAGVGSDWARALTLSAGSSPQLLAGSLIATSFERDPTEFMPEARHGELRLGRSGPNTIINDGRATATDVIGLARRMRDAVESAYEVRLESEVVLLGLQL